mmetsp:Transcript_66438/g.107802  ORF Transcript_66438/g.107802 Transcript_66438/m.107802 type:complete len:205 (-) Transcript_66438:1093-1707(-)
MTLLTIKRDVPRTRSAAGSGRSRDGLAATARRPRLVHSLHPPLSGSATFAEDTASCLRLPILTAWQHEPLATSVRTSGRDPRVQPLRSHVPGMPHTAWQIQDQNRRQRPRGIVLVAGQHAAIDFKARPKTESGQGTGQSVKKVVLFYCGPFRQNKAVTTAGRHQRRCLHQHRCHYRWQCRHRWCSCGPSTTTVYQSFMSRPSPV